MSSKIYLRPLSLVFGADARRMIADGSAGALGGMGHIGFTQVQIMQRDGASHIAAFADLRDNSIMQRITKRRSNFGNLAMDRTHIMGIVNVTPDSFSDGGRLTSDAKAIAHGKKLAGEGADILDIGGESTRPGSDTVSISEEISRIEGVIAGLSQTHAVSVDTRKAEVMRVALKAGANIVNDVSALSFDTESASVVAQAKAPIILMHAQGEPKTMQLNPRYSDVVMDVYDALEQHCAKAEAADIARHNICIDPGIGFGKTFIQNLQLMAALTMFHGLGVSLLVGLSRKGFVGAVTGEKAAADRVHGSVGGALQAAMAGAHILRVHDVKATAQALAMFTASCDPDSVEF
jgi:dihydropteroate synthase